MSDSPDKPDLSLYTDDEIADALQARCEAVVLIIERDDQPNNSRMKIYHRGGHSRCLGMVDQAHDELLRSGREDD